jgi:predicted NUDIX family NTP pyrophosphohydrolase
MSAKSAGILMYRKHGGHLEFLLVHPGGPFWKNKDAGAWTIPKGEFTSDEDALNAATREFHEETGATVSGSLIMLTPVKQKSGKLIYAWAVEGDLDPANIISNMFPIEWPPKSGQIKQFPEVDRAAWFDPAAAKEKINPAHIALIDELISLLHK